MDAEEFETDTPSSVLAAGGKVTPVQETFLECGASQCGFCTPSFVLMAGQLLAQNADPNEIRHYLSGNLCRCGTYPEIIEAVNLAAHKISAGKR
jgi:carbon-monoxide dehydrogenase small subunit